jgi:cytochrome b-561
MPKLKAKLVHALTNILGLCFLVTGLTAIIIRPKSALLPDFRTTHSWQGLTVVVFYATQWLLGFVSFLYPKLGEGMRRAYLAYHRFWGVCIFVMACGNALLIIGYFYSGYTNTGVYAPIQNQGLMINLFMVSLVVYALAVVSLVAPAEYARPPDEL